MYRPQSAMRGIDSVLRPKSIAVIGASGRRKAAGNELLRNLAGSRFGGHLHVVHPDAAEIEGLTPVPAIADLPAGVDVAFVSLPAHAVVPALAGLAEAGCRSAVVPTAGMTPEQLADLARLVRTEDMVVHGPNCMGVINASDGIPLWPFEGLLTIDRPGNVALVSQSGSATIFVTRSLERAGVGKVISTGSEIGLSAENYLTWLAQDPDTDAVGLVLESIKDVSAFVDAVRALREAGKPLVTLKVGRTEAGAAATTAHTGALVGRDEVYAALFDRLDVPLVADYDELAASLELLSWQAGPSGRTAGGRRVAAITISGGQAALAGDLAFARDVPLAHLIAELAPLLPGVTVQNPLDTGDNELPPNGYRDAIAAVANDPGVDSVLVVLDAQATMNDVEVAYEEDLFEDVAQAAAAVTTPVVVASSSSVSTHARCRQVLGPVPLLRGIGNGLVALRALGSNKADIPHGEPRPAALPTPDQVVELRELVDTEDGALRTDVLQRLITAYGLPFVASTTVDDATEAERWVKDRYPVVAKIDSPDITHRSDIGAVVVGIGDAGELTGALQLIADRVRTARPTARIAGFELQEQVPPGVEALLGFVADPVFGATVTVGMGGTLVELLDDAAAAAAPLSEAAARDLIGRTRLGRLLGGYRNLHPVTDLSGLVDVLVRLSWFAADFADLIAGADFNPAVVQPGTGRVLLVDALVERSPEQESVR